MPRVTRLYRHLMDYIKFIYYNIHMISPSIGKDPSIKVTSNWLTVDKNTLRADVLPDPQSEKLTVSAEDLRTTLLISRSIISQGIEEFFARQIAQNPDVVVMRPSIWTTHLGTPTQTEGRAGQVFTAQGYENEGSITSMDEIQPQFHGHWNAVKEAGFLPEVRRASGKRDGGSWLLLRKPTLSQVLHNWFDHPEGQLKSAIETIKDEDKEAERRKLLQHRILGEGAVDQAANALRSKNQVALLLSMAAIKSAIGNRQGSKEEADDALEYASNDPSVDESAVRAIENSMFERE